MSVSEVLSDIDFNMKLLGPEIDELHARAERAEALLADERNRVANLEKELAARPAVTEETVQAICRDWYPHDPPSSSVIKQFADVLRMHLLPATPEPVPQKPDEVMRLLDEFESHCHWTGFVDKLRAAITKEREAGQKGGA